MARFVVGDVVAAHFPFSNLKGQKLRPALIVAQAEFGDLILCQITSKAYTSKRALLLTAGDFAMGALPVTSYVRPDKLFTAEPSIAEHLLGRVKSAFQKRVLARIRQLFVASKGTA